MKLKLSMLLCWMMVVTMAMAQQAPENWFNLDEKKDGVPGISTERTYEELLKGKTGQTIIVAVIDSGVDHEHEDLSDIMWTNPGEIPNNQRDDDGNGYVDDIHGWNFLGGKDGKNVHQDNLEMTRLYRKYHAMYENAVESKLSKKQKAEYALYKQIESDIEENQEKMGQNVDLYENLINAMTALQKAVGKDDITKADLEKVESDDPMVERAVMVVSSLLDQGASFGDVQKELTGAYEYFFNQAEYYYNPDFDPRSIVGDNYADSYQKNYGNNDSKGPDASHGTHVAGIIGAARTNDVGIKGVANNVRIMSVRTVPDGDERDKDVANAIIYAVDNGASVINMSFGKGYAWDKKAVDAAVKYARKKDVLLVHAAGNSSQNNDTTDNFPNDKYEKAGWFRSKTAKNWMEIGALNWKNGEDLAASFSNYGKANVDVFAPGVDIYSTTPENTYDSYPGTSMAAPMVAGTAALLRSYFPLLTAEQVKDIIMSSARPKTIQVKQPGTGKMVPFNELSVSGGILNVYDAVQKASKVKGKRKVKSGVNMKMNSATKNKKDEVVIP